MRRPSSFPVLVQVAALAAMAVLMSQAVAFAVVLLTPEPPPSGFSLQAATAALKGEPARTTDDRLLTRRFVARDPFPPSEGVDLLENALAGLLATRLEVPRDRVRVVAQRAGPGVHVQMLSGTHEAHRVVTLSRRPEPPPGAVVRELPAGPSATQFTVLTNRLTFAPFSAALQLEDGRWAVVEPPRSLLSPWQRRFLTALGISLVLLAPLVWWMAGRLTRPIRLFADAAERLGADPEAPPLQPSGPAEVRTAIAAFNDMQAKLADYVRQRGQVVAAIAHDLRTPLTRLRFRAEQAPAPLRERMAADIEEMSELIGEAMAYVRGDAATARREAFDLSALAQEVAHGFAETGADVSFAGAGRLGVVADPAALRRAIANLIDNAVAFAGAARVRAEAENGRAVVLVEDSGPGLPEEEMEAVFEPFRRGERSRSRSTGGAGLGLAVARQAARAAGGEASLSAGPAGGLIARLEVPLAPRG